MIKRSIIFLFISLSITQFREIEIPVAFHIIHGSIYEGYVEQSSINEQMVVLNSAFEGSGISFYLHSVDYTENLIWSFLDSPVYKEELAISPLEVINIYTVMFPDAPAEFDWDVPTGSSWTNFFIFQIGSAESIYDDLGYSTAPWDTYGNGNDHYFHGITLQYKTLPGIFNDGSPGHSDGNWLIHLMGQYLGLYNIYGNSFAIFEDDCSQNDDFVIDTPLSQISQYAFMCMPFDSCEEDGLDDFTNYMSFNYDDCINHFTLGQFIRIHEILEEYRPELIGDCPNEYVLDCSGSEDCWSMYYIGDGVCDNNSIDLSCYENDGGDCNVDLDEDGVFDHIDNCIDISNSNQFDSDLDNIGNACDPWPYCFDIGLDPFDECDVCNGDGTTCYCYNLFGFNFGDCEEDLGFGLLNSTCQLISGCLIEDEEELLDMLFFESLELCENFCIDGDLDNDAIQDEYDNCIYISNNEQLDYDLDGFGDDCDPWPICFDLGINPYDSCNICNGDGTTCGPQSCYNLDGFSFGECDDFLGVGWVNGSCETIEGCDIIGEEELFSELFFETTQECESTCFTNELGDINQDSLINVLDIVMIIDFILGYAEFTTHQATLADINLDGDVNVNDIVMLIESILD